MTKATEKVQSSGGGLRVYANLSPGPNGISHLSLFELLELAARHGFGGVDLILDQVRMVDEAALGERAPIWVCDDHAGIENDVTSAPIRQSLSAIPISSPTRARNCA